jgi:hypothetical protein
MHVFPRVRLTAQHAIMKARLRKTSQDPSPDMIRPRNSDEEALTMN